MKPIFKSFIRALVAFAIVLAIFYWPFIYANIKYDLAEPQPLVQITTNDHVQPTGTPNQLVIASLNITAPIVYADATDDKTVQTDLQSGVVHYANTANPGTVGNCYIFGHSSDYLFTPGNFKTVFAVLPKIAIGDQIQISDSSGKIFVYTVTSTKVVAPNDTSVLSQDTNGARILNLQTSYPVGTALKRFIATAQIQ